MERRGTHLKTVVMFKQPGQRTSMKKELGDWMSLFFLCLEASKVASGFNKSCSMSCKSTKKGKTHVSAHVQSQVFQIVQISIVLIVNIQNHDMVQPST